jgi:lipopolysaccharide biosynthesis regulator YciM
LTGLVELLRMQIKKTNPEVKSNLNLLQQMIDKLLRRKSTYQCDHCGYETKNLYWMCPSCQKWDKIKPIPESGSSLYPP